MQPMVTHVQAGKPLDNYIKVEHRVKFSSFYWTKVEHCLCFSRNVNFVCIQKEKIHFVAFSGSIVKPSKKEHIQE